jgi:hypothetical protein
MKKETIYSLDKRVPIELVEALAKAVDAKEHICYMLKSYTNDYVTIQKKIILLNEQIKKFK